MATEEVQRTILLCKPSSQSAHHIIAQELQAAGLPIVSRLFNLAPERAMSLVLQYPAVRSRVAEHMMHKTTTSTTAAAAAATGNTHDEDASDKAAELPEYILAAQRHRRRQRLPAVASGSPSSPAAVGAVGAGGAVSSSSSLLASRQPDHRLLTHIQQLAQGLRPFPPASAAAATTTATAAANVPRRTSNSQPMPFTGNSTNSSSTYSSHRGSPSRVAGSLGGRSTAHVYRRSQLPFPTTDGDAFGTALDTVLDHPALADTCVRHHVEHIIQDGTVLVLLVKGTCAVDRVAALCGPDSVSEARESAPESWTARFGHDDVHNGVYAPHTVADAQAAVGLLFPAIPSEHSGRAGGGGGAKAHAHTAAVAAAAVATTTQAAVSAEGGGGAALRAVTYASVLPALRAKVGATHRLSYYTGASVLSTPSMPAVCNGARATTPLSASTGRAETYTESSTAHALPTPTAAMTHSATARLSTAAPFPERRERLDELSNLLGKRAVGV